MKKSRAVAFDVRTIKSYRNEYGISRIKYIFIYISNLI